MITIVKATFLLSQRKNKEDTEGTKLDVDGAFVYNLPLVNV